MADFKDLNAVHQKQMTDYLRFFRQKVNENVIEIEHAFDDTKDMTLLEEMFTAEDVENILDTLRDDVKTITRTELEKFTHQSVAYLQQMYLQAEGHDATLKVDTNKLDDQVLLEGLKALDLADAKGKSIDNLPTPASNKLTSLGAGVDTKLVTKIKELQEANDRVQKRFDQLQEQTRKALKENTELKEENEKMQKEVDTAKKDLENIKEQNTTAQQLELEVLRKDAEQAKETSDSTATELKAEIKNLNEQLTGKVSQTKQYQQLNKMLKAKNVQLKEIRARVKVLEEAAQ